MVKAIYKKFISNDFENGIETIKHYKTESELPVEVYNAIVEEFEDWDNARDNGVQFDENDNYVINIRRMLEYVEDQIQEIIKDEDIEENYRLDRLLEIKAYFTEWVDWKLWM